MITPLLAIFFSIFPYQGSVAFVAYTESTERVMLLDFESMNVIPLGPGKKDGPPVWSPDGTKVAFSTLSDNGRKICIVSISPRSTNYITHTFSTNQYPAWNKDSSKLAYQSGRFPNTSLSVYDLQTKFESQWGDSDTSLMKPAWLSTKSFAETIVGNLAPPPSSPIDTGKGSIAALELFQQDNHWTTRIVIATEKRTLPFPSSKLSFADRRYSEWSIIPGNKDRSFIYESNDGADREIFLASRSTVINLSNHRAADINPAWSPDSKWIAFESFRGGHRGIYRSHRNSGRLYTVLQSGSHDYWSPSWSPDSTSIICVTNKDDKVQLLIVDNKSNTRSVPLDFENVGFPAWRPES